VHPEARSLTERSQVAAQCRSVSAFSYSGYVLSLLVTPFMCHRYKGYKRLIQKTINTRDCKHQIFNCIVLNDILIYHNAKMYWYNDLRK